MSTQSYQMFFSQFQVQSPLVPREISVLTELALGHLRYRLTDVPPQPNSPPDTVFDSDRPSERAGDLE